MSTPLTRRERREQMRRERPSRGPAPAPRGPRRSNLWLPIGILAGAAAVFFALSQLGVFAPGKAPFDIRDKKYDVAGETIGTKAADEGNAHVPSGQKVQYGTLPPTSGSHWGAPAGPIAWGIKDTTFPDEAVVHNLEHGGIVIGYKGLNETEVAQLKDLVRVLLQNGYPKIVLEPYPAMTDARIALSAWHWQLKLNAYDDVQIVKFVKSRYESPEAPEPNVR